jgi:hypothetical protein
VARIRTIKPEFFSNPKMARVPIEARYLFSGLWTQSDDEGRLWDSPKAICGAIFPHDEKVTEKIVEKWLSDLAELGSIIRYEVDGVRYICVPAWEEHQKISHARPSQFPTYSGNGHAVLRSRSGIFPE